MSSGATSQLNANEDVIFCLNPQISYFKSVYRKYTKFIVSDYETSNDLFFEQDTSGNINIPFPSQGELLSEVSIRIRKTQPTSGNLPDNIGTSLIDKVELLYQGASQANNNVLETVPAEYINFMSMLNNNRTINSTYETDGNKLVCNNGNNYQNMALSGGVRYKIPADVSDRSKAYTMDAIVPIPFSFTKNIGSALPILKLIKENLSISITQTSKEGIFDSEDFAKLFKFRAIFKFIYLSEEEKYRFKSSDQEYLISKVKKFSNNITISNFNISDNFVNHPITSMFIVNNNDSFKEFSYQLLLRGVNMQSGFLPHEFYSKLNINQSFKGAIYKYHNQNNRTKDQQASENQIISIENNISYIPFSLKTADGPSGCIDTSTNDLKLKIYREDIVNHINLTLYVIYNTIMTVKDNNILFPYGYI
uniref:Major capsid protein N-terminal domain-containing protein n=1 Tax=viral metagenome TaxID=1070528 RepID=A0A6C0C5A7_9ZZZZ